MNQEFKNLVVEALRSGQYTQMAGRLSVVVDSVQSFCALGVVCDVLTKHPELVPGFTANWGEFKKTDSWPHPLYVKENSAVLTYTHSLPGGMMLALGLVDNVILPGIMGVPDETKVVPNVHWHFKMDDVEHIQQDVFEKTGMKFPIGACRSVAGLNDNHIPFSVIADIIEKYS